MEDRGAGRAGGEPGRREISQAELCLARLFLPLGNDAALTADNSPENLAWLAAYLGHTHIEQVSKAALLAAVTARFGPTLTDAAIFGLSRSAPALSAHRVITRGQVMVLAGLSFVFAVALAWQPQWTLRLGFGFLSLGFVASALFRAALAFLGARSVRRAPPAQQDATLPLYTVMVPLYREAAILPALAAALNALDYPRPLLDIKLVIEGDDLETLEAARGLDFELVVVPPCLPRTKPKAANYALCFARGEYLVVYDAEDRPEPDQLLKAVGEFRRQGRRIACLQARLNFYNAEVNWLTRGIMAQTPLAVG